MKGVKIKYGARRGMKREFSWLSSRHDI